MSAAVAATLTFALWPDAPTDDECKEMFVDAVTGAKFPDECTEWLDSSVDQIEQQATVIAACKEAVVKAHAQRWTPELEFTSSQTSGADGNVHVTGTAESVNALGERWEWTYECTVSVDNGIRVLTVGTKRA